MSDGLQVLGLLGFSQLAQKRKYGVSSSSVGECIDDVRGHMGRLVGDRRGVTFKYRSVKTNLCRLATLNAQQWIDFNNRSVLAWRTYPGHCANREDSIH